MTEDVAEDIVLLGVVGDAVEDGDPRADVDVDVDVDSIEDAGDGVEVDVRPGADVDAVEDAALDVASVADVVVVVLDADSDSDSDADVNVGST